MSEILRTSYLEQVRALKERRDAFDAMADGRMELLGALDADEKESYLDQVEREVTDPRVYPTKTVHDPRPANCRFRLHDEGKAYPKSSCSGCGRSVVTGRGVECHIFGGRHSVDADDQLDALEREDPPLSIGNTGPVYRVNDHEPDPKLLETFPAAPVSHVHIKNERDEFTCLCPATGQPDFGRIEVVYQPRERCLESRSWKLYLVSYRNTRMYHEQVVSRIFDDLLKSLRPRLLTVTGHFTPRGGISFTPTRTGAWPG